MSKFRIIPVIDILNSEAVHAKKGERDKYKPLNSRILNTSKPFKIVKLLKENYDFNEIYIADLDSILHKKPNVNLISEMSKIANLKIILDPGITNKEDVLRFSKLKLYKLIIGLESVNSIDVIRECIEDLGQNKVIVSVDMYDGKIISKLNVFNKKNPINCINVFKKLEVRELILLDLFRVGQKIGGIPPFYLKINQKFEGKILVGGGIKNIEDTISYKKNNFSGILIATALYDETIKINELKEIV
ncbi:MAG: HisA/HisF-related TIM barrel protein [Candidatus Hermodarchaeota archaeon]